MFKTWAPAKLIVILTETNNVIQKFQLAKFINRKKKIHLTSQRKILLNKFILLIWLKNKDKIIKINFTLIYELVLFF